MAPLETADIECFRDGDYFIGWLKEYPEYMTQGETLDELKENLADILKDVTSGAIPRS
jgi:predicted RNase H-like HicB family nuclease